MSSSTQSTEVPGDPTCICQGTGLTTRLTETGNTGPEICECVIRLARKQGAEEERERLKEARRDTDGVPFLDAARALCPDEAHWEDGGWERYEADASACLDAFFAALTDNQESS